jgi:hypothetical protein
MIHVFITVKESKRFPGKNRLLAPYTITWLLNEAAYIDDEVAVYTVGKRSELPLVLPKKWKHIPTACEDHLADSEYAESLIQPAADDVCVQLLVTQPIREQYLLSRAIDCIKAGNVCCITASAHVEDAWRKIAQNGTWAGKIKRDYREAIFKINGQLYAWKPGNVSAIFDPYCPHKVLRTNSSWGIVDIDYKQDIPPALSSMWASVLLDSTMQQPLVIRNKKVLLIGSGKDLVGRKLGQRIDSGEWDIVVRLNHYYGAPEDVGTRTDLAILREARFESAFIDEAPVCPSRVLSTNDGFNFPESILDQAAMDTGQTNASIGIIAACWLLHHGANITVIGIGHYPDGTWIEHKTYPDGTKDTGNHYDWNKENAWWESRKDIITLL